MLRVVGNGNSGQFQSIKSRLAGMPPAYTAEQIAKGQTTTGPEQLPPAIGASSMWSRPVDDAAARREPAQHHWRRAAV
jgi:hypothetical protein